jgi:organic radical activating enzyme
MLEDGRKTPSRPAGAAAPREGTVTGNVSEMFCSIQGEGIYVGERQLFLRTAGCSATCYWCDTVASKQERSACLVHGLEKRSLPNPLTAEQAVETAVHLIETFTPVRTVSITGGEPLEQAEFVARVAKLLKAHRLRVYLETNGLEVDGLMAVRPLVDVIAMDVKLPSATGREHWDAHRTFLEWLVGRNHFVKIVVDYTTPLSEITEAITMMAEIDRTTPLVLQPESGTYLMNGNGPEARQKLSELLEAGQRFAAERLNDVRIIPQCHKLMKVR